MKLYTKTGDTGLTSLYNGTRIKKTSYHFTCLGDFDELNASIGMAKSFWTDELKGNIQLYSAPGAGAMHYKTEKGVDSGKYYEWFALNEILSEIQCRIMDISSIVATPPWDSKTQISGDTSEFFDKWKSRINFKELDINQIEKLIDRLDSLLPKLTNFVIPGNNKLVSQFHIIRTITRRCERAFLVFLEESTFINVYTEIDIVFENVRIYINRLSDLFFVLSRFIAMTLVVNEEIYKSKKVNLILQINNTQKT